MYSVRVCVYIYICEITKYFKNGGIVNLCVGLCDCVLKSKDILQHHFNVVIQYQEYLLLGNEIIPKWEVGLMRYHLLKRKAFEFQGFGWSCFRNSSLMCYCALLSEFFTERKVTCDCSYIYILEIIENWEILILWKTNLMYEMPQMF